MIAFKKHPFRWVLTYVVFKNLPLMWQAKSMNAFIRFMRYCAHFKDDLLGKKVVVVKRVDTNWIEYTIPGEVLRVRDITYKFKREKLPFSYPRVYVGTQWVDDTAWPLRRQPHADIVRTRMEVNEKVAQFNKRQDAYGKHAKLRGAIVGYQFQEYDHDQTPEASSGAQQL